MIADLSGLNTAYHLRANSKQVLIVETQSIVLFDVLNCALNCCPLYGKVFLDVLFT